jgi:hypothetical protein
MVEDQEKLHRSRILSGSVQRFSQRMSKAQRPDIHVMSRKVMGHLKLSSAEKRGLLQNS